MTARRLKVYGWYGQRTEAEGAKGRGQTREIVAAPSVAEIMRQSGCRRSGLWNLCETGNESEIATALAEPGVVFWHEIDDYREQWTRAGLWQVLSIS